MFSKHIEVGITSVEAAHQFINADADKQARFLNSLVSFIQSRPKNVWGEQCSAIAYELVYGKFSEADQIVPTLTILLDSIKYYLEKKGKDD